MGLVVHIRINQHPCDHSSWCLTLEFLRTLESLWLLLAITIIITYLITSDGCACTKVEGTGFLPLGWLIGRDGFIVVTVCTTLAGE